MQGSRLFVVLMALETIVAAAQSFSYTKGAMQQARAGAASVVLQNGTVLIVGGEDNGVALSSAELYDPVAETFHATGSMRSPRFHPQVQMLWNSGDVLVIGGDAAGQPLTTEVYNWQTGTFVPGPSAPEALDGVVSAPVGNDRILITGVVHGCSAGSCTAPVLLYSPAANSLTPVGALPAPVTGEAAVGLGDGTVLFYGGAPANLNGSGAGNIVQIFNALTHASTVLATSSEVVTGAAAIMLADGSVLLCGGSTSAGVPQINCRL